MGYVYLGQSRIASIFKELPVETLIDKLCNKSAIEILDIPEGVSAIGDYLFYNCPNLTNVIIPASVKYIGEEAFYNSDNIEVIEFNGLPPSTVGENVFPSTVGTYKREFHEGWEAVIDSSNNSWKNLTMEEYVPLETIVTYYDGSTKSFLIEGDLVGRSYGSYYTTLIDNVQNAKEIRIGKAVTSIDNYAFAYCSKLTSITIPSTVTTIGFSVFLYCSKLTSVTIPPSVTSIKNYAFAGCTGLTSVTIPESVTWIGKKAFSSCSSLTSVVIPEGVMEIGEDTFYECSSLTLVTIPSSVTSIGGSAFQYCSRLRSITIPAGVTSIGGDAFRNCSGLTSITFKGEPPTSVGTNAFKTNNTNTIGYYLSENKAAWEAVIVDGKCNGMTMEEYVPLETIVPYSDGSTKSFLIEGKLAGRSSSPYYTTQITNVQNAIEIRIGKAVTTIGSDTFHNCSSLSSVTIPSTVTSVGSYTLRGCSRLTSVTIPSSVTSLGSGVFQDCSRLTSITIPSSVTSIGMYLFYGCSSLTSVTIPEGVTTIASGAFSGCSSLPKDENGVQYESNAKVVLIAVPTSMSGEFVIPNTVRFIHSYAFQYCSNLTSVTIPSSVKNFGQNAFYGCSGLTTVTISDGVPEIGSSAFWNCSNLTSITIPSSVTSIGSSAFRGCSTLTSITFEGNPPSAYTSSFPTSNANLVGYYLHENSTAWKAKITDGKWGVLTMEEYVPLETIVTYSDGSTASFLIKGQIRGSSYSSPAPQIDNAKNAKEIRIGKGVTSIGQYAFGGCESLISLTIPSSVTSIDKEAFWYCYGLTSIVAHSANQHYSTKNGLLYSKDGKTLVRCPGSLTTITIPEDVTSIGTYAFEDCRSLTSVTIPSSVTSIGDWAFLYCKNLTEVTIPTSVTTIEESVFYGCEKLTSITIPEGVLKIGYAMFQYCRSLTSVTIPSSVTSIGYYAFASCTGLTSVTIPSSVTSIGSSAFEYCRSLTSITFEGKTQSQVKAMSNYDWSLAAGKTIICTDGSFTAT